MLSTGSTVASAGSTGATGVVDGSVGSTRAAKVGGGTNLDDAATGLAVDAAVASPSVPQRDRKDRKRGLHR